MAIDTIENGHFQRPDGTTIIGGTLTLTLSQGATVSGTGQVAPASVSFITDSSGNVSGSVWGNDQLTPSGTSYTARVYDSSGVLVRGPEIWILEGSSPINLDTLIPTGAAPAVSYPNPALIDGDNVFTGSNTFNGPLNSNDLSAGNVANKPTLTDAVQFVTTEGNDSNDGLSWGTAKATIAGALAALPNITPPPPINGNTVTAPGGRIKLGTGTFLVSSQVTINGAYVRVEGSGMDNTIVDVTAPTGIEFNRSGSYWPANGFAAVSSADGGLFDLTLQGNGSSNQIGVYGLDAAGLQIKNVRFLGFNGTNAIGYKNYNDSSGYTERQQFENITFDDCTIGWVMDAVGVDNTSYGHNQWSQIRWIFAETGQVGLHIQGYADIYSCQFDGVFNTNFVTDTISVTCVVLSGSNCSYSGYTNLTVDNGGNQTVTTLSGATSSNWKTWGYSLANGAPLKVYNYGFQVDQSSNGNSDNGIAFQLAGTTKMSIYLDGNNGVSFWDGTDNIMSVEPGGPVAFGKGGLDIDGNEPSVSSGHIGIGSNVGFGNGSSGTAVTTTTKSTGTGPTTPQTVVNYLKINVGGSTYWIPLVQ